MQNYLRVFIDVTVPFAIFGVIGLIADQEIWRGFLFGGLIGLIAFIPIGIAREYDRYQWILALGVGVLYVIFSVEATPYGLVVTAITGALTFLITVAGVSKYFEGTGLSPLDAVIDILLGRVKEPVTEEVPKQGVKFVEALNRDYGPRLTMIKPDAAVIMEKGSEQTKIVGPNTFQSEPGEYISRVYRLKPIHKRYRFRQVLTKDLIAVSIIVSITYGVDVEIEARIGERDLKESEKKAIQRLDNWTDNWEQELRSVVEKRLRNFVGRDKLEKVASVGAQSEISRFIRSYVKHEVRSRGLKIYHLDIVSVRLDQNITRATEEKWLVNTRTGTMVEQEKARGEAWRAALEQIVYAYDHARQANLPDEMVYRELLRRVFEQATINPQTRNLLPPELGGILADLRSDEDFEETDE